MVKQLNWSICWIVYPGIIFYVVRSREDEIYAVYVPSEQQDPISFSRSNIGFGTKDQFPSLQLSARSLLGQATFVGTDNGEEAP